MNKILEMLTNESNRLPNICNWLKEDVWSMKNFSEMQPAEYLEKGESEVAKAEGLMLSSANELYNEITNESLRTKSILENYNNPKKTAVIIFDGSSIRELPLFEKLAAETDYNIVESTYTYAALPSESQNFIEQRIIPGKKLSPSQLQSRSELKERNIKFYYYDSPSRTYSLTDEKNLLLWSHFPDGTYQDLSSKFSSHFNEVKVLFEAVWKNIVLMIPKEFRIIITSDHGYIFFGQALESAIDQRTNNLLNGNRFKIFEETEILPEGNDELQVINSLRLAMLRGRIKNRIQGPAGNKAYKHGGMSLMEMLTPWLVLEKS